MEKRIKISHFTDPLCFWCYAMEPAVRPDEVMRAKEPFMKAVVQRVEHAAVHIGGNRIDSIGAGALVLLGIGEGDTLETAKKLWSKIFKLRIFEDDAGKANLSLSDAGGSVMVVSQFTLYADCKRGNRPSFTAAMEPVQAERLYEDFLALVRADMGDVAHGRFGAMMSIELCNAGPFTIVLDTDTL